MESAELRGVEIEQDLLSELVVREPPLLTAQLEHCRGGTAGSPLVEIQVGEEDVHESQIDRAPGDGSGPERLHRVRRHAIKPSAYQPGHAVRRQAGRQAVTLDGVESAGLLRESPDELDEEE